MDVIHLRVLKVGMLVHIFTSYVAVTIGSIPVSSNLVFSIKIVCLTVAVTVLMVGGFGMNFTWQGTCLC